MTELIPGKRYRVVFEGTADYYGGVSIAADARLLRSDVDLATTVELLPDPLPTTPGSVIQYNGELLMRVESATSYVWGRPKAHSDAYWGDSELEGATVLFDAGAPRA